MEIFLTLAQELHFGRTAERLHLSGAMVSQTLKKIERRLGGPLFERTSRRVALTPLGQQLYDDMRPHFDGLQAAVQRAASAARGIEGTIRVGFLGIMSGIRAHQAAGLFRDRHPDCAVEVREVQLDEYVFPLRDGTLDMLMTLVPIDEPDITVGPLVLDSPVHLAVSAKSPLARRESLTVEDLVDQCFASVSSRVPRQWLEAYQPVATPSGLPLGQTEQRCATFQEVLALVSAGECVAMGDEQLVQYYSRPDIVYVPMVGVPNLRHGLVWRTASENARIRAFVDAVADAMTTEPAAA